jgi:hypothetical protein
MRKLALFVALLVMTSYTPEKELSVSLKQAEWEYVLTVLQDRPKKEVDPLFDKIVVQLRKQLADTTQKKNP